MKPKILRLHGIYQESDEETFIVMEYMNLGSLKTLLSNQPDEFEVKDLEQFGSQICEGMVYLAQKNVIMRDLGLR